MKNHPVLLPEAGIDSMPASLREALDVFIENPIAKETLGDHTFEKYIINKETEWDNYRISVTDWEIDNYLGIY
jgi:glutamine synthetase